jgi:protoheme IX farnesyltransferase
MINYYLLTKPWIVFGNLITLVAGFMLASKGTFPFGLFLATLFGLSLIMASACVFNNYIDRHIDRIMKRTQGRALVIGLIPVQNALFFGTLLGIVGGAILLLFTNLLALAVAVAGFFVYVCLYSLWKCHTVYGTAIGSIAGAVPPVVGYCAVSNRLDAGAFILFLILVLWQMPHFFAIALSRFDDYAAAKIPVLPVVKGAFRTKIHMTIYIIGFILATLLLPLFHYTGSLYLFVALNTGLIWLGLSVYGFKCKSDQHWGQQMFRYSLVLITLISVVISLDTI